MKSTRISAVVRGVQAAWLAIAVIAIVAMRGSDWPQYRGADHDGSSTDRILDRWPTNGPSELWRTTLLNGYSTFVGGGGKVYTLRSRDGSKKQHVCVALDATTGVVRWTTQVLEQTSVSDPNSTPTLDGNCVYVLSNQLGLMRLDAETGTVLWKRDLIKEFGGEVPIYGNAASPTVEGDLVYVNSGCTRGTNLLAFRKTDGQLAWNRTGGDLTYPTPIAANILGVRQVIFRYTNTLVSVVPETGAELWNCEVNTGAGYGAITPTVYEDIVFQGNAVGGIATRISKSAGTWVTAKVSKTLRSHPFSTPVCYKGHVYGVAGGSFCCVDLLTGETKWSRKSAEDPSVDLTDIGGVLLVNDRLLILTYWGFLVLAEASSDAYTELACCKVLRAPCLNHPIVYDGRVYARNPGEGVCLDIAARVPGPIVLGRPQRNSDGSLQFPINDDLGNCLSSERMAGISILASTNLNVPGTNWQTTTDAMVLTNGMVRLTSSNDTRQRFFIGVGTQ